MRVTSGGSKPATNLYHHFSNGKITIQDNDKRDKSYYRAYHGNTYVYTVESGDITGYTEYLGQGKRRLREVKYGESLKEWNEKGKLITDHLIKAGTILAIKPRVHFEKYPATLYGQAGTLTLKKYGGSLRGERFSYKGGRVAYDIRRGTKAAKTGFEVLSPDKKVYARYAGEIDFTARGRRGGLLFGLKTKDGSSWEEIEGTGYVDPEKINIVRGLDYAVEVKDKDLKTKLAGQVKNHQRVDKWIEDYKKVFYILGVAVSSKLYHAKPEELDPQEILDLPNAQLRASFISKIGLERIIQKLKGQVIDTDPDRGYDLISLPLKAVKINQWDREPDTTMKILKVRCPSTGAFYCLRVPPAMEKVEQARQWTFGQDTRDIKEAAAQYIELERET